MEEENLITTEELNKKSRRRKLAIGIIIGIILGITSIFIATKVLKMIDSNKKDKTDKVEKKEKNKYSLTNKHLKEIVTMLEKKDNITMGVLWRENEDIGPAGSIKKMNLTDIKDLITILYSLDGVPSIKTTEDFDKVCAGQYGISVREGDATVLYSCSFNKGDEQQGVQLFLNSRDIYFFKTNDKLKTWNEAIEKEVKDAPIQYSGEDVDIILNQVAVGFTKISMITSSSSNDVAPAKIKRFSSSNMNDVNKIMDILRFNYRSEPLSQMVPMGCGGFNNIVIEGSEFTASTCSTADAKEVLLILKNTSANTDVNYVYNFTRVNDKNTWAEVINNYTKNQKEEG